MEQKIVISMNLHCEGCIRKIQRIAAKSKGVMSVSTEREKQDRLVVTGSGVDALRLIYALKKVRPHAEIVSVTEAKKEDKDEESQNKGGQTASALGDRQHWVDVVNNIINEEAEQTSENLCYEFSSLIDSFLQSRSNSLNEITLDFSIEYDVESSNS